MTALPGVISQLAPTRKHNSTQQLCLLNIMWGCRTLMSAQSCIFCCLCCYWDCTSKGRCERVRANLGTTRAKGEVDMEITLRRMQHKEDKMQRECDTGVTLFPHHCHVDNQHVITINTSLRQNRCALVVQLTAGPAIAWTCCLQVCDMFWLLVHMCVCVHLCRYCITVPGDGADSLQLAVHLDQGHMCAARLRCCCAAHCQCKSTSATLCHPCKPIWLE